MNNNDIGNLRPAKGVNGKQMSGLLIRMPQSKSNSKFPAKLAAAFTSKGERIRGLWWRTPHGPFVAQITDRTPEGVVRSIKVTLQADSLAEAKKEHQRLILNSADGKLAVMGKTPKFGIYASAYMQAITDERKKAPSTIKAECCRIEWWRNYLGDTPLNKLSLPVIRKGLSKLASEGRKGKVLGPRSLNYYVTGIRCVLSRAMEDGWIRSSPIPTGTLWRKLPRSERPLFTQHEREQLCKAAIEHCPRNGQQLADLVGLMCFCGARIGATLRLSWPSVDWDNKQLIIARDGDSKGKSSRRVDFNPALEKHLRDMHARRKGDGYLFPSEQRRLLAGRAKTTQLQ